tara:strand:- start:28224 stop:28796 length:573 start_codon:yes stop_codon:yes gene_type:complete
MSETKDRILTVGIDLFSKKGYHNVGLKEILAKAEVPKGSFYYYFDSKEDFGIQVINKHSSIGLFDYKTVLEDKSLSPKNRIIQLHIDKIDYFKNKACTEGCLMGNASNELSDVNESFRNVIAQEFNLWQNALETCIIEAQEAGEINKDIASKMLASFILNSWEGALLRMKCEKSIDPLQDFVSGLKIILS